MSSRNAQMFFCISRGLMVHKPLSMDADIAQRYQELELYLRQPHAGRDLEVLGREVKAQFTEAYDGPPAR